MSDPDASLAQLRKRNWLVIMVATLIMMVSYFVYVAAFVGTNTFDPALAALGVGLVPFVLLIVAFGSRNEGASSSVLRGMGLFLAIALGVGLIDPALGFSTAFGTAGAVCLRRPDLERVLTWRLWAVLFCSGYCLVLLVVASPAGVFSAGLLPLMMVGFADEFIIWRSSTQHQALESSATLN